MKYTELSDQAFLIRCMPRLVETMKLDSSESGPSVNRLSQKGRRRRARQKLSNCGKRVRK
jgi:hypothetical protein